MNEALLNLRRQLRPIFEMLKHRESQLSQSEWLDAVNKVHQSIKDVPDQYLSDYPPPDVLETVLGLLFAEFVEETL